MDRWCLSKHGLPTQQELIHSAQAAHYARLAAKYGLASSAAMGDVRSDMKAVKARKTQMVDGLVEMHMGGSRTLELSW